MRTYTRISMLLLICAISGYIGYNIRGVTLVGYEQDNFKDAALTFADFGHTCCRQGYSRAVTLNIVCNLIDDTDTER